MWLFFQFSSEVSSQSITGPELLGKPSNSSITVNVVADAALEAYFEYGTVSGVYADRTGTITSEAYIPLEAVINGLTSNTRYYYRMVYRGIGDTS